MSDLTSILCMHVASRNTMQSLHTHKDLHNTYIHNKARCSFSLALFLSILSIFVFLRLSYSHKLLYKMTSFIELKTQRVCMCVRKCVIFFSPDYRCCFCSVFFSSLFFFFSSFSSDFFRFVRFIRIC